MIVAHSGGCCGFCGTGATPERTAFVRFGKTLIAQRPDRLLFEMVTAQLKARAITVKNRRAG